MNWTTFQTYNDSPTKAFEVLCNQLFENWCKETYKSDIVSFNIVNGNGGDGGVESFATLKTGTIVGIQAKWFQSSIKQSQINQIKQSIKTAMNVHPEITRYIVCIPRDLTAQTAKSNNSETSRWNKMKQEIQQSFPELLIELWNETRILSELQKETSYGIFKFWFENAEISQECFKFSFEKSKKSWLNAKYVPELNTYGKIDKYVSSYLGHIEKHKIVLNKFIKLERFYNDFLNALNNLVTICNNIDSDLESIIDKTIKNILAIKIEIKKIISFLNNDTTNDTNINLDIFRFNPEILNHKLKELKWHNCFFHISKILEALHKITKLDINDELEYIQYNINKKSILFLGEPGTGKTHGVAAEAEKLFKENVHIPLLIQARNIPIHYNWKDLLVSSLDLSSTWSEEDLWQALCSLANRKRFQLLNSCLPFNFMPKILIIIDGLDESSVTQKWIERIQEANVIMNRYSQIRFCFTSRPNLNYPDFNFANILFLNTKGDAPVSNLFDDYIKAYNIIVKNDSWIKYTLTTPLSLKLFCDINQGQTIDYYKRADISIASLLKKKITLMDNEFCEKNNIQFTANQYILQTIIWFAEQFNKELSLELQYVITSLMDNLSIERRLSEELVQFLANFGVLRIYCKSGQGYLSPDIHFCEPGIQGYFDYATTIMLLDKFDHPNKIIFDQLKNIHSNALYCLAIIAAQKYGYLITLNSTIDYVANLKFKKDLLYISLRHLSPQNAEQYLEKINHIISNNAESLVEVINNLVLPLSREINHPFGIKLIDNFLSGFELPAKRDIIWSTPVLLKGNRDAYWYHSYEIAINNIDYCLNIDDTADTCPILYAWGLASINNTQRKKCRISLMAWALLAPEEFYKLFLRFSKVNDPQIRSDMFAILMSLLFENENTELIKKTTKWLIENVLAPDKIHDNQDISIRYYSCAIIQKAISLGIININEAKPFLPPYKTEDNNILLNAEAIVENPTNGYKFINYDLARYVLIDHFTFNFPEYIKIQNNYATLIDKIALEQPTYKDINFAQFIISAAFAFITKMGWNEEEFCDYNPDTQQPLGIDSTIIREHYHATHGEQSLVMTICEKYVWQARNEISGFLADHLLFSNDKQPNYLQDYGLLDDFIIPIQELQIDSLHNRSNEDLIPCIPDDQAIFLQQQCNTKEEIQKLINESPEIDWKKWIYIKNENQQCCINSTELLCLYNSSCFYSPNGIETCIWISSAIVPKKNLKDFVNKIKSSTELCKIICNPEEWNGRICSSCYITPKEICWFPWKDRDNGFCIDMLDEFEIQSAVDTCYYKIPEEGEICCNLPSAPIRKMLNITNSDGRLFWNKYKQIKSEYYTLEEESQPYQNILFVDKNELVGQLNENKNELVWIMREYRRENGEAREKFGDFYAEKDISSVGFFYKGKFTIKRLIRF